MDRRRPYIDPAKVDRLSEAELNASWMSLGDAMKYVTEIMHLPKQALLDGLRHGTIKSVGDPDGQGGYHNVEVQVGGLLKWVAYCLEKRAGRAH